MLYRHLVSFSVNEIVDDVITMTVAMKVPKARPCFPAIHVYLLYYTQCIAGYDVIRILLSRLRGSIALTSEPDCLSLPAQPYSNCGAARMSQSTRDALSEKERLVRKPIW